MNGQLVNCERWTPCLQQAGEENLGTRKEVQKGRLRHFSGGI